MHVKNNDVTIIFFGNAGSLYMYCCTLNASNKKQVYCNNNFNSATNGDAYGTLDP